MKQRTGATLIEVLVAIFVMSLGLMGLLVLFPLGALSMAQAIQDNRTAQAAASAAAFSEILEVRNDANLFLGTDPVVGPLDAFGTLPRRPTDPPPPFPPGPWPILSIWTDPATGRKWDGPSYPVYVDYLGVSIPDLRTTDRVGEFIPVVGPNRSPGFQRRIGAFTFVRDPITGQVQPSFSQYLKCCTLLDDVSFKSTGLAVDTLGAPVQRDTRYSWAYLLRRPRYWDRSVVDLVGVVYSGRSAAVSNESVYSGILFDSNSTTVTVTWNPTIGEGRPAIRPGSWILDATVVKRNPSSNPPYLPDPHGFFYRVVNVTDGPTLNQITLELQTKPRVSTVGPSVSGGQGYGILVVMENVVEVFEKSAGWKP
jgi:hypothetical protein